MQIDVKENETGYLLPISLKDLPFEPRRIFIVKNKMKNAPRGDHAHVNEEHMLVCLSGEIHIKHEDMYSEGHKKLKVGDTFYQKELQWLNLRFLEENTVLLVIANKEYDEKNYIRNYKDFKEKIAKERNNDLE